MRRWKRLLWVSGGILLGGVGTVAGTNAWIRRAAAPYTHEALAEVPARSHAIVPGARVHADGRPYPVLEDRLEAARALHAAGRVDRILVSGDHGTRGYDETTGMRDWLVAQGVPPGDVVMDHAGFRTLDTMERAARVFGVRDAVVCTQRFHLARSVFLARRAGIDAVGLVADRRVYRKRHQDAARELIARTAAFVDSYLLRTEPAVLGEAEAVRRRPGPSPRAAR